MFLVPEKKGAQWSLGAVGNAEWTGVRRSTLFERTRLEADAYELIFEGADSGTLKEEPVPPAPISCARSLSRSVIGHSDVLLAYQ